MNESRGNTLFVCAAVLAVIVFAVWMVTGVRAASPSYPLVTELKQGPYTLQVKLSAPEAVMLKPNTFTVTIRGADERPVSGAAIDISLFMPDMFCGTSTAKATEVQPGVYQGEGIPLMAGSSAAEVKVQVDGQVFTVQHPFLAVR